MSRRITPYRNVTSTKGMERSISGSSNGNSLNPRLVMLSISILTKYLPPKDKPWSYRILVTFFYNVGRLQLTTTMVWSSTRVTNRAVTFLRCLVFLLQKNFCKKAKSPAWAFVLQLQWQGMFLSRHILLLQLVSYPCIDFYAYSKTTKCMFGITVNFT